MIIASIVVSILAVMVAVMSIYYARRAARDRRALIALMEARHSRP